MTYPPQQPDPNWPVQQPPYDPTSGAPGYPPTSGVPGYPAYPVDPYQASPAAYPVDPYQAAYQPAPAYPPAPGYGYGVPMVAGPATNTMAITSMILSLLGIATCITAPVGAILGHMARRQIRERGENGAGMALTGIIVGWIITVGFLIYLAVIVIIVIIAASNGGSARYP